MNSHEFCSVLHEEIKSGEPDIEKIYDCLEAYGKTKDRRYFKSFLGEMNVPDEWEIIVRKPHPNYGDCVDFIYSKDEEEGSKRFPCLMNENSLYDMIRNVQCNREKVYGERGWISPAILVKGKGEISKACFELVVDNYMHTLSLNLTDVDVNKKKIETFPAYMHKWDKEMENVSENLGNNLYEVGDLEVIRAMVADLDERIKNR